MSLGKNPSYMPFCCPKCAQELKAVGTSLFCSNQHCFDRAKAGYYNLLLAQGQQKFHGDNPLMVSARRAFLEQGYYLPFCQALAEIAAKYAIEDGLLLDCGCGEGYYTQAIYTAVHEHMQVAGIDISKDAVAKAAKKTKGALFAVASAFHLPLPANSVSMLLQIFSPHSMDEFSRVLQKGGIFIEAFPGPKHLFDLKKAIYDTPYENTPTPFAIEGYDLLEEKHLEDRIELSCPADIDNLFKMTPYYYKTGQKEQARAKALQSLSVQTDFYILVYRKR